MGNSNSDRIGNIGRVVGDQSLPVRQCARCGRNHKQVLFKPLTNPMVFGTTIMDHWGLCPVLKQPILLGYQEDLHQIKELRWENVDATKRDSSP